MKYLIAILFCTCVYAQSVKVSVSDKDSLWQDFKFMYSEINKDNYWITLQGNKVIFYDEFACDVSDIDLMTLEKIKERVAKNK